jgi:hypothetical protein
VETVHVEFTIPDSLAVLRDSGSIGCSFGGPVDVAGRPYHCQALLYAKNSDSSASLKLLPRRSGIAFCSTLLGTEREIERIERSMPNRNEAV